MENIIQYIPTVISYILVAVAILVAATNIITQVLKGILPKTLPTNILAFVVAMVVTLAAFFAVLQIIGLAFRWYLLAGAIVLGFAVAYAAMYSFDKLKQILESIAKTRYKEEK